MNAKISPRDLDVWADYLLNHSLSGITKDDVDQHSGTRWCYD